MNNEEYEIEPIESTEQQDLLYTTRSEEVQEIMGRMPSWIIRWGITLMGVIILVLFVGANYFKYPDVIPAMVEITSANPPVNIIARNNLPIEKLLVEDGEKVAPNQLLGVLRNSADFEQIEQVAKIAQEMDTVRDVFTFLKSWELPLNVNLGELQSAYIALVLAGQEYLFFREHNTYGIKLKSLQEQSVYQQKLLTELKERERKMKEQLSIQQQRFDKDSSLVAATVMSQVEYENARKELLDRQMSTEGNYTNILQNRQQQNEIASSISETETQWITDKNKLEQSVREAVKQFNGALRQWEENYVFRSPVAGKVSFYKYWKENQFVRAGETVMMVSPSVDNFEARGMIGLAGAGKIKENQKVLIQLYAYPYQEYGSIEGIIAEKSVVPMDSIFAIQIQLTKGLATNANFEIPIQPKLSGTAQILTDDKSVLARLFDKVYGEYRR